jgi:Ca-activated chloride channel family protein
VRAFPVGLVALLLSSAGPAGCQVEGQTPTPKATFRTSVDLVRISAVVQDRRGRPVVGLSRADFELDENGTPLPIVEFGSEATGVSLALLVDASGSMSLAGRMDAARDTVGHVISWVEAGRDEVTLLSFDKRLRTIQPFTTDPSDVQRRLPELESYGLTSLYDAIADASRPLVARSRARRAVVVVTDGVDTSSVLSPAEVSRIASEIDVPVYVVAIRVGPDRAEGLAGAAGAPGATSDATLEDLARWTGGAAFVAGTPAETSLAARRILIELRHQYLIAFEANPRAGWHPLSIGMRKKNLIVRARGGYMTDSNSETP